MSLILHYIETGPALIAWLVLALSFAVLARSADSFVDSSVALAERLRIPKVVIGIVLVSLATTAPELAVSMLSALAGKPEMALGNAIGSVICNCGLALALCGVLSTAPIPVLPRVLRTAGAFLLAVAVLTLVFVLPDTTLGRGEGAILVVLFFAYLMLLFQQYRRGELRDGLPLEELEDDVALPFGKLVVLFGISLIGIIVASRFVVVAAITIARAAGLPESVIALTLVALGTSIPEVATSIIAARKGEGELSVGNILGANIMNVCWVAGASAAANPLPLGKREVYFMFPAMFIMVGLTLAVLRSHYSLSKKEGLLLCAMYLVYLASFIVVFDLGG